MSKTPNARLKCMLSNNRKKVMIFRQGPSKWTQLILWDLENNIFKEGQWLQGSIYVDKSDISPDGKYVCIAIAKYSIQKVKEFHSWTTISKPPFFTSLCTFLEKEGQARGAYFEDKNNFIFNGNKDQVIRKGISPEEKLAISYKPHSNQMSLASEHPLNERRLTKNGWITSQHWKGDHHKTIVAQIKSKQVNPNLSILMEREINNFKRSVKYSILKDGNLSTINDAQWMDVDYNNNLLLAKNGKIYSQGDSINKEIHFNELIDFNHSKPKEVEPSEDCLNW